MNLRNLIISACLTTSVTTSGADWPQWRFDAGRTGTSLQELVPAVELQLQWTRKLPPLEPAFRDGRLQFDRGYEPVVLGKQMFIGSSHDDSLIALDTETGKLLWRFTTGGPIRFAPVAWQGGVYFGSDDGHFYCLNATDGSLRWKFQAVPSDRQVYGNRRLISMWPVRGGPVLQDGRIYFAAGVWSFEGVFVYALDARTGEVLWLNDDCGYIYGVHPHNAVAFGGLAPQGYLLINRDELVVPSSSAYPAKFDLQTGRLLDFKLPAAGRKPGGWFVATGGDPGESKLGLLPASEVARKQALLYESSVNRQRHEGEMKTQGGSGIRTAIRAADQHFGFSDPLPGVEGTIHTLLVADEKLFVVTEQGEVVCLGEGKPDSVARHPKAIHPVSSTNSEARDLLDRTGAKHGIAIVLGLSEPSFIETLASQSQLKLVVIGASEQRVASTRRALIQSGLYGHRIAIRQGDGMACELPPYLADLIFSEEPVPPDSLHRIALSVRPFGGKLVVPRSKSLEGVTLPGFQQELAGDRIVFQRVSLPGSTNYTGDWKESADRLVRAPLGVLWFDDSLGHFKRSPQPRFVDGVMISSDKVWSDRSTMTEDRIDYRLHPPVYSDVYTGRILAREETPLLSAGLAEFNLDKVQPRQYRPPKQKDAWKPEQPESGSRRNPLTGIEEPRTFPKSYGCDGGFDYGDLYSMRSGTAAFYDKRLESGTINLSGPRSGCTNSIIPANGVLNVPYFFEGCTCSYPLPTALALFSMPQTHEQWASWGDVTPESLEGKIERVGINFGAPGDRMTEAGTLWLDHPNIGGPSPQVRVNLEPAGQVRYEYRHSLWIKDPAEAAWPWVSGSAVIGARKIQILGLKNGTYEAKLTFAELEDAGRSFAISVQDTTIEAEFAPAKRAGGKLKGIVLKIPAASVTDGILQIELSPNTGETTLGGIELIRRAGS